MAGDDKKDDSAADVHSWIGTTDWVVIGCGVAFLVWFLAARRRDKSVVLRTNEFRPVPAPLKLADSWQCDDGFVAKMKASGRSVAVFYGSQTGTAEDLAYRLVRDANRYGLKGSALDPEECDFDDLTALAKIENNLAVFCMATYGEGDPTDNAIEFKENLQRRSVDLSGLNYAVFGLGNKTYEHFNAMGKFTDQRLAAMNARPICPLGLGDDDGNMEEDFMLWRDQLWMSVCTRFKLASASDGVHVREFKLVNANDCDPAKTFTGELFRIGSYASQKPPYHQKNPFLAPVICNRELNPNGDRSIRHIEFDLTSSRLRYEAGDHLAVYPANDADLVDQLGKLLNTKLDDVISLDCVDEDSNRKHPFPVPCSYRTALTYYVDVTSLPKTNVLAAIAEHCRNSEEKNLLLKLTSVEEEGRKLYSSWVCADHRTVVDILHDLPSCRPPLDLLLELLPRLQPRYYSISSSPKVDSNVVSITVAVLQYKTPLGRRCKGVATNYLASKVPHQSNAVPKVPIFIRRSQIRVPYTPSVPVLMIGPGTGIAPFRGFIQERIAVADLGKVVGDNILYFGCRQRTDGYLYQEELENWHETGKLSEFYVAFSREQSHKVYVQHLMMQNKTSVWNAVRSGAHIYVCGDAKNMARDVQDALIKIFVEEGNMNAEEGANYLKSLESRKLYQADVWS